MILSTQITNCNETVNDIAENYFYSMVICNDNIVMYLFFSALYLILKEVLNLLAIFRR